jgi:hypothetical protein
MAAPVHSVKVGTIDGSVWQNEYGYSFVVRKPKRKKKENGQGFDYVKDAAGKQVYVTSFGESDLAHITDVILQLRMWAAVNPAPKSDNPF